MAKNLPLVLIILDGWGYREEKLHNAIAKARTPQWDNWLQTRPHMLLEASGSMVGLPNGQMGNSEVGHMHIGAGRVISQDFTRINEAIANGEFNQNQVFVETIENLKRTGKALHVLCLLSKGGVHSHERHLFAFLALCSQQNFCKVYLHLFLDGRDTPPQSALLSLEKLQKELKKYPVGKICSLSGRYFAMDRDQRWQRIEPVYRLLTEGLSEYHFNTAEEAVIAFYKQNIYDEFIPPSVIGEGEIIQDGDSVVCLNFRADRVRQLTEALVSKDFYGFSRHKLPKIASFVSMTQYAEHLSTQIAFPHVTLHNTLGEIIEHAGLRQLRLAETEKYAHVTFFLNGGSEQIFPHEKRILIPSPKVATYDLQPEMSANKLTEALVHAIESQEYDVIICNYANADMVGHTGDFNAAVNAIECIDKSLKIIWEALSKLGGQLLITADHGNAECMFDDKTQQPHTAHTNEPVPLLYVGEKKLHFKAQEGSLIDVAPTVLALLGINAPKEMTGTSLLVEENVSSD